MKKIIFSLVFALNVLMLHGQQAFRHVTNTTNTSGHITTLDHPQLNGNPNAMVFIMPNYNTNGADPSGADYQQNAGVWYNGSRWTIFNQNTKALMPMNLTFNVLIAPPGNANYFTISCTAASKTGLAPNAMVIDHPATNNKPDALLLVTQNWANTYNDNSPIVSYSNGKWYISNNKYLLTPEISAKTTLPIGARFNVMVVENNTVSGFPNAKAFMHTTTAENIIPSGNSITFFDQPFLNGNSDAMIWATPNWGWSSDGSSTQTAGPYNDSPIKAWYDHPNDRWNHKNGFWSIYNSDGTPMPNGAKFNIVTIEMNSVQPYAAFKHTATTSTISGHETILEHASLNNKPDLILQVTPDYREVYNAASIGVRYDGSRWRVFNIDRSPMPANIRFNIMAERADANHFIHVASAGNTGNPNAGVTTIDHPALNDNPSAILLVAQTPGTGNVYNNSEVAVWYTGKYWNIYNENKSGMPAGASFHVSILSPAAAAGVHSSASGNIWGQVPSATETDYADPQKLVFITHNGSQGDWNPEPCGVYYPPGRNSWSILTGNTARMLERRRFNVLAVNETQADAVEPETPLAFLADSPTKLSLNQLLYKNNDIASAELRLEDSTPVQNEFVVFVSTQTNDSEVVKLRRTTERLYSTESDIRIRTNATSTPNDGILSVNPGELFVVYYFPGDLKNNTQGSSTLPGFVVDFGTVEDKSNAVSPYEVNNVFALTTDEKDENGIIQSGTLLMEGEIPVQISSNQVIFYSHSQQDLNKFLAYSNGKLLSSYNLANAKSDTLTCLIEVDLANIDLTDFSQIRSLWGGKGKVVGSNSEVLKLIQFCIQAMIDGYLVGPNPKLQGFGNDLPAMSILANPPGANESYSPTIGGDTTTFDFLHIPKVWNYMALWDRDNERINVAVLDHGFEPNADYRGFPGAISQCLVLHDGRVICNENAALGPPTVGNSGIGSRTWHGNAVVSRLGGVLNNSFGTAGTGGQVVLPMLYKFQGEGAYAFNIGGAIRAAADNGAQVINISGGYPCRILTRLFDGYAPNICNPGDRLALCGLLYPIVEVGAITACSALGFVPFVGPALVPACLATLQTAYITSCVAQLALGNTQNILADAVQYARQRGVPVVASAGNFVNQANISPIINEFINLSDDNMTTENWLPIPAVLPDVICVGATGFSYPYENTEVFGERVDIWAPSADGYYIAPTTTGPRPEGGYLNTLRFGFNGTSAAAPYIAGLVANAMAFNPRLNPATTTLTPQERANIPREIRNLLVTTAWQNNTEGLPDSPRRRNLVNPLRFMERVNAFGTRVIPDFAARGYDNSLNFSVRETGGINSDDFSPTRISADMSFETTGTIIHIPGTSQIIDRDGFGLTAPAVSGMYGGAEVTLTTPRSAVYGNLIINGRGVRLLRTRVIGTDEEEKVYSLPNLIHGETLIFWVEGNSPTDDNLYKIRFSPYRRTGDAPMLAMAGASPIRMNLLNLNRGIRQLFFIDNLSGIRQKTGNNTSTVLNQSAPRALTGTRLIVENLGKRFSSFTGNVEDFGNETNVFYINEQGEICHLRQPTAQSAWELERLSTSGDPNSTCLNGALTTAFIDNVCYLFYIGRDENLRAFRRSGTQWENILLSESAEKVHQNSDIAFSLINNIPHLFYTCRNNKLQVINKPNSWQPTAVSTGLSDVKSGSRIVAGNFGQHSGSPGTGFVFYISNTDRVIAVKWSNNTWSNEVLPASLPASANSIALNISMSPSGRSPSCDNAVFFASGTSIFQLSFNNSRWEVLNIHNRITNLPRIKAGSDFYHIQEHAECLVNAVYYIGDDNIMHWADITDRRWMKIW